MSSEAAVSHSPIQIVDDLGRGAKLASAVLANAPTDVLNAVLSSVAEKLNANAAAIIEANKKDLSAGE